MALTPKATSMPIVSGLHGNPFAVLGVHERPKGLLARCFIPGTRRSVTAFTLAGSFRRTPAAS
jgi:1,4-alpha-glucan branching enzyme